LEVGKKPRVLNEQVHEPERDHSTHHFLGVVIERLSCLPTQEMDQLMEQGCTLVLRWSLSIECDLPTDKIDLPPKGLIGPVISWIRLHVYGPIHSTVADHLLCDYQAVDP